VNGSQRVFKTDAEVALLTATSSLPPLVMMGFVVFHHRASGDFLGAPPVPVGIPGALEDAFIHPLCFPPDAP
jgi:hypothetical protein